LGIGNLNEAANDSIAGATLAPLAVAEASAVSASPGTRLTQLLRHPEVRRLVAFVIAGGLSALVTISVTAVLTNLEHVSFFWSAVAGTELGILVNFSINDRLAFRDLEGRSRPLLVRVTRFHVTCAMGQTLILLLSLLLHDLAHWSSIFAQALPIGMVTCGNFLMHRFWTYRAAGRQKR
jgi:putative flippase GtrA